MNGDLISHPDKLLITHLSEVTKVAVNTVKGKSFNFSLCFENSLYDLAQIVPKVIYMAAAFHDLGKATLFFQNYIRNPQGEHDKRKSHALISAVFVYYITEKYLSIEVKNKNLAQMLSVFAFSAVKRHHGRLINLSDEILVESEWRKLLPELAVSIDEQKIVEIINIQLEGFHLTIDWCDFLEFLNQEKYDELLEDFSFEVLQKYYKVESDETKLSLFYIHQLIYSALLFADKNEVILNDKNEELFQSNIVERIFEYRNKHGFNHPKSGIDELKNSAFYESAEHLEKVFDTKQHIYSVTLPTGLGKTITAFMLADKLRKLSRFESSRIIINIPFTSIIDQNFEVYAQILQTYNTNILLKHHHLAEPIYKSNENILDYYKSQFLIETWQSDTVVTTFVQLLETILSCDKTKLMKFAHLANSVILLDEIQTIPYSLWETIRESFKILGEKFNIYFILISATQPLIFTPNVDIVELVPDYKKYFHYFNRTKLILRKESLSFTQFKSELAQYIATNPQKDVLTILNTKRAARETFEFMCSEFSTGDFDFYFLTTLITPFERKEIIKRIKAKSERQKIIISTQLVEAGVDISVDTVFRQISPLDSIIQAAGRANRYNKEKQISEVHIYDIKEFKKASNMVYGNDLLLKTENVLANYTEIEEKDYIQLIENYFVEVRKQSDNTSQPILNAMRKLDFGLVDFELIENRKTDSVFVQLNGKAQKLWEEYVNIYSSNHLKPWERDAQFSKIKSDFYDFVINVPIPDGHDSIDFDSEKEYNFYVSKLKYPSLFYQYSESDFRKNIGYKTGKEIKSQTLII